jgi:putative ABC transport system substrate-binding protein
MRRREFITLLGGAAATWPFAAHAQRRKLPTIGFLGTTPSAWRHNVPAFTQRLGELGWTESIAGRRAAASATARSRPSSSG